MPLPIGTILTVGYKLLKRMGERREEQEGREKKREPARIEEPYTYNSIVAQEVKRLLGEVGAPQRILKDVDYIITQENPIWEKIALPQIIENYHFATDPKKVAKLVATFFLLTDSESALRSIGKAYIHLPHRGEKYVHALAHRIAEGVDHSTLLDETLELLWKHPHEGGYRDILMDYAELRKKYSGPLTDKDKWKKEKLRLPESRHTFIYMPYTNYSNHPYYEDHPIDGVLKILFRYSYEINAHDKIHELIFKLALLHKLEQEGIVRREELEKLKEEVSAALDRYWEEGKKRPAIEYVTRPVDSLLLKYKEHIQKHAPEEEREAPIQPSEALKIAVREQLPGWAIKTALDEEKRALYTGPEGVHHSLIRYHLTRSSPDDPQGAALHPLLLTLTGEWERQLHAGLKPTPPLKLLNDIVKRATGKSLDKIDMMSDEELESVASELGLPQTLTPQAIRESLKELYRDLKDLEEGRIDPHQLDAEKEASIRHLQLKLLAGDSEPHPQALEIARRNIHTITDLYRELKRSILEETQLGREEQEKLLTLIENELPTLIEKYREMLGDKRVSNIVADLTKEFRERLEEEGIDPAARAWATNLLRNLLLDAPIIAAARDPTITWKPLHEKKKIAAGLAKLYEEDAKRHKIAPISSDIYWMYSNIRDLKGEEALERVLSMKNRVNTVQSAVLQSHSGFRSILETHFPNKSGFLSHEVIPKLQKVKKRLFETSYPRITKRR